MFSQDKDKNEIKDRSLMHLRSVVLQLSTIKNINIDILMINEYKNISTSSE